MDIKNIKIKKTSKFIRQYGMTLKDMSSKYNYTIHYLWSLHLQGKLHEFIKQQDAKQKLESNIEEGIERSRKLADEILERVENEN